jgi:hypothetical protein
VVGTLTRRSASKRAMRRFSLLGVIVLALVASGCFGGSADKSSRASEAMPIREAALTIGRRDASVGSVRLWRFQVSCPPVQGDVKPTLVCQQITAPGSGFFGVQTTSTTPLGGTGSLRIRGTVNGVAMNSGYLLGGAPQYGNWMRVLFTRPLDAAITVLTLPAVP